MPDLLFLLMAVHNIPVLWSHSIECWKYLLNMFSLKKIHKVIGTLPQWHNLHVKMPLICFFLPLLESPPAPYNPNASYPRSSAADLLINNCMGKPRNIRIQFSPYNLPWVCTKKPWQGRGTAVAGVCQRTREKRGSNCPWLTPLGSCVCPFSYVAEMWLCYLCHHSLGSHLHFINLICSPEIQNMPLDHPLWTFSGVLNQKRKKNGFCPISGLFGWYFST